MTEHSSTDRHAELIEAGWRVGTDGRWRGPDPTDRTAYASLDAAWTAHIKATE